MNCFKINELLIALVINSCFILNLYAQITPVSDGVYYLKIANKCLRIGSSSGRLEGTDCTSDQQPFTYNQAAFQLKHNASSKCVDTFPGSGTALDSMWPYVYNCSTTNVNQQIILSNNKLVRKDNTSYCLNLESDQTAKMQKCTDNISQLITLSIVPFKKVSSSINVTKGETTGNCSDNVLCDPITDTEINDAGVTATKPHNATTVSFILPAFNFNSNADLKNRKCTLGKIIYNGKEILDCNNITSDNDNYSFCEGACNINDKCFYEAKFNLSKEKLIKLIPNDADIAKLFNDPTTKLNFDFEVFTQTDYINNNTDSFINNQTSDSSFNTANVNEHRCIITAEVMQKQASITNVTCKANIGGQNYDNVKNLQEFTYIVIESLNNTQITTKNAAQKDSACTAVSQNTAAQSCSTDEIKTGIPKEVNSEKYCYTYTDLSCHNKNLGTGYLNKRANLSECAKWCDQGFNGLTCGGIIYNIGNKSCALLSADQVQNCTNKPQGTANWYQYKKP